jgi:hypothetical protein
MGLIIATFGECNRLTGPMKNARLSDGGKMTIQTIGVLLALGGGLATVGLSALEIIKRPTRTLLGTITFWAILGLCLVMEWTGVYLAAPSN